MDRPAITLLAFAAVVVGPGRSRAPAAGEERRLSLPLGGKVSLKLVRIPRGSFLMGSPKTASYRTDRSERPRREVTITRDFYLGRCEVTRGQYAAFVKDSGHVTKPERLHWAFAWDGRKWGIVKGASWRNVGFEQTDDHPVLCVSWDDAVAFCKWLGAKTGRRARLPTEAEWEYACRAGSTTAYCWGDDRGAGKGRCNAADRIGKRRFRSWSIFDWEDGCVYTAPVGTFQPNAFGLHDMHGNVWEWCSDRYARDYRGASKVDPKGPAAGKLRVLRGGSWLSSPPRCRSAFRAGCDVLGSCCDFIVGFRVVVEIATPASRPAAPAKQK